MYTAALTFNVVYIQSIGLGIQIFSGLFNETIISQLLLSSLPLVKPRKLTKEEQEQFVLTEELKAILVGLFLGDLYGRKQGVNAHLQFTQGTINKYYLLHLYELFESYCFSAPKYLILYLTKEQERFILMCALKLEDYPVLTSCIIFFTPS